MEWANKMATMPVLCNEISLTEPSQNTVNFQCIAAVYWATGKAPVKVRPQRFQKVDVFEDQPNLE